MGVTLKNPSESEIDQDEFEAGLDEHELVGNLLEKDNGKIETENKIKDNER